MAPKKKVAAPKKMTTKKSPKKVAKAKAVVAPQGY